MTSDRYLVVGAGLAGAATAWQLARRGHEVVHADRSRPGNDRGSSHGSARILRYSYADPFYTDLVAAARHGWEELARLSGAALFLRAGCVDFGIGEGLRLLRSSLAGAGIPHEVLAPEDAATRWPGFAFDSEVLWHQDAGTVDAEGAVRAMTALAIEAGARLIPDWAVDTVRSRNGGYRVRSQAGESLDVDRIVVCAGGWLPDLLPGLPLSDSFRTRMPPLEVRQEQVFHFPYRARPRGAWPAFIHQLDGIHVYGLPGGRDAGYAGQKVAIYNGGSVLPSAAHQDGRIDPDARRRAVDYATRYLPGLVPEPYAETTCLFTNTPTEDFVVDGEDGITIVSACSGHGAKFAPEIGRIAADAADGTRAAPERFRLVPA